MIKTHVEEYCHECPNFNPVVTIYQKEKWPGVTKNFTRISCANKEQCEILMAYLSSKQEKEN